MTQMFLKNVKNFEFQQKQIMMLGGIVDAKQKKLSPEVIKQMQKDYRRMYFDLVSINWGQGKTLGVSWQKGLEQMDAFVASKVKIANHPANDELLKFHTEFRKDMAKTIMTNPYVEDKLDDNLKQKFLEDGMKDLSKAKGALDNMYKQYMPEKTQEKVQEKTLGNSQKAQQLNVANHKTEQILQILMQQRMNARAA